VKQNLVIRADAGSQIGTGHVMRCLALAQAWQDVEGYATFLMAEVTPALKTRLHSERVEVIHFSTQPGSADDAVQTRELAQQSGATWVVMDGYRFGADYQRIIKDANLCILFIDDNGHSDHYYADIVLNQNIYANESLYSNKEPYTQLLLGTRYVLLRREFLKWQGWKRNIPKVAKKVLVTLGGSDPDNVTLGVIRALNKVTIPGLEAKVIVGTSNHHFESLKNAMLSATCSMHILKNVDNMSELMAWADVAVSAGGSTCWELAFMGLSSFLVPIVEHQVFNVRELGSIGTVLTAEDADMNDIDLLPSQISTLIFDSECRMQMSHEGQALVDGMGLKRVVEAISIRNHGKE
jgi:UDP-2,4-diacetamido-2,4,6-trideoxy-beta-L-altropyranose hydrolase